MTTRRQASSRRYYYWLTVQGEDDKPYLVYGGLTEDEARQQGLEILGGIDFKIVRLPTRNLARASSLLKGNRLEQTHSLRKASRRLGHDKSLRRLKRKRATGDQAINNW